MQPSEDSWEKVHLGTKSKGEIYCDIKVKLRVTEQA